MRGPIVSTKWKLITCPKSIVVDVDKSVPPRPTERGNIGPPFGRAQGLEHKGSLHFSFSFFAKNCQISPKSFRQSLASQDLKEKNQTFSQKVIMANYAITRFGIFLQDLLLSLKCCYHHQFSKQCLNGKPCHHLFPLHLWIFAPFYISI